MTNKKIQPGYLVTVEIEPLTSESGYQTKVFEGLSKEDATFRVELARLMKRKGIGLENEYEPSDALLNKSHKKLLDLFAKYPTVFDASEMKYYESDVGAMTDTIAEMLTGTAPRGYYMRAVSSVTVHHVEAEVVFREASRDMEYSPWPSR